MLTKCGPTRRPDLESRRGGGSSSRPVASYKKPEETEDQREARLQGYSDAMAEYIEAISLEVGEASGKTQKGDPCCESVFAWLRGERRISKETMIAYNVGSVTKSFERVPKHCVTFPWYTEGQKGPVRVKVRAVEDKKCMRLDPAGTQWGFFGWNLIKEGDEEVVITEGELDALTVYQETGKKALSLPNGAKSLPPDLVQLLERFKRIYLWLDDDVPGQEGATAFARKLGVARCLIVQTRNGGSDGPKDANDALQEVWKMR